MRDVFELEPSTVILADDTYIVSYPHLLSFFSSKKRIGPVDVICGAHMVYGWMPTVLELYPPPGKSDLSDAASILEAARAGGDVTDDQLTMLIELVNNSLVGASKLLHFVAPDRFPIWDSKIYSFFSGERPYHYRVNNIGQYRGYIRELNELSQSEKFPAFFQSVNKKLGYAVTPMRALELIMFLNAPVYGR